VSLDALVEEALRQNYDLKQALARIDAARAQARIAGADLYPQADFNFSSTRREQVFVGFPIPGRGDEPLKSLSTTHVGSFNLSWELDVWGRVRAGQSATLADVQSSEEEYRAALLSVAAQATKGWLAVVAAERQLELARATYDVLSITASQIRERYRRGLRSALDLRLALNNEAVAKALISFREQELQTSVRQLETLLGRYPAGALTGDPSLPPVPRDIPAGLPSELLERRADLVAAERRLAANLARVREAKRALLPRISLTASGGRTSDELADLLSNSFNMWSVAGNFAQPLFQGGRLRANVKLNEARAREALEAYRSVVLRAFGEVETTLESERQLQQREIDLAEAARQSSEALRLAEERYFAGLIEFVTLTESQRNAYNAESELIAVREQRLRNRVDLHLALGGGFERIEASGEKREASEGSVTEEG
jgi:NodT family efflux transporter outer membrane factor (OMF) lipoprotein